MIKGEKPTGLLSDGFDIGDFNLKRIQAKRELLHIMLQSLQVKLAKECDELSLMATEDYTMVPPKEPTRSLPRPLLKRSAEEIA